MQFYFNAILTVLLGALMLFGVACSPQVEEVPEVQWFKGNTHAHTVLCGHADSEPDSVARWYLNRGYHFLVLSEHNQFIDPDSVLLPEPRRSDFILIPGEEVTGHKHIHTTALNIKEVVFDRSMQKVNDTLSPEDKLQQTIRNLRVPVTESKTEIMQRHTHDIRDAGGIPILNHPNFVTGAQAHEILPVDHLHFFELYNGHPAVYNWGNDQHVSVEEKWDSLLSAGKLILGISSDDAHHFQSYNDSDSNPGRGWTMVNSGGVLTSDAITQAMARGDFYASSGVALKSIVHSDQEYSVCIDSLQTLVEIASPHVVGKDVSEGESGFLVEFIGSNGKVLSVGNDLDASYQINATEGYVRARITYTQSLEDGKFRQFFAWTQPRFLDHRADQLLNDVVSPK